MTITSLLPPAGAAPRQIVAENALLLLLFVGLVLAWATDGHRRRRLFWLGAATLLGGLWTLIWLSQGPGAVSADWITILQERTDAALPAVLSGTGAEEGPNFTTLLKGLSHAGVADVRAAVCLNVLLTGWNVILLVGLASAVLRRWWLALLLAAAWVATPFCQSIAVSEQPSALITLYALMGAAAWAIAHDGRPRRLRRASLLGFLALLTLLLWQTRRELFILGALLFAWELGLARGVEALSGLLRRWLTPEQGSLRARRLLLASGVLPLAGAAFILWRVGTSTHQWNWGIEAANPFNLSYLMVFSTLGAIRFPLPAAVLVFFGLVHCVRRWRTLGGLALAFLLLSRTYEISSNMWVYELFRYMAYLTGPLLVLSLLGWNELEQLAVGQRWPREWVLLVGAAFGLAVFHSRLQEPVLLCSVVVLWLSGQKRPSLAWNDQWGTRLALCALLAVFINHDRDLRPIHASGSTVIASDAFVTRDLQKEMRFLVRSMDRSPGCVFVARTIRSDPFPMNAKPIYDYRIFDMTGANTMVPDRGQPLSQVIAQAAPGGGCVRLFRGLDCNLSVSDGCPAFGAGLPVLGSVEFRKSAYNDTQERGETNPTVRFAVYKAKGTATNETPLVSLGQR